MEVSEGHLGLCPLLCPLSLCPPHSQPLLDRETVTTQPFATNTCPLLIRSPPPIPPGAPRTCQRCPSSRLVFRYPQTALIAAFNRRLASLSIFSSFNLSSSFNPSSLFIIFFFFFFLVYCSFLSFIQFVYIILLAVTCPPALNSVTAGRGAGKGLTHLLFLWHLLRSVPRQQEKLEKLGVKFGWAGPFLAWLTAETQRPRERWRWDTQTDEVSAWKNFPAITLLLGNRRGCDLVCLDSGEGGCPRGPPALPFLASRSHGERGG